ncbi:kinase-like domain [Cordyceps militaris]|uniref:Kinase-like domain n=1 Tax=Cordyceps militaris TaxID=73501 RepID=A0A2H4SQ51_CORMI|nr:kinase-like domain [Cordyceps militaris]
MSTDEASRLLGSDAWLEAGEYEPGSELHTRATNFVKAVNWDALATTASQKRGGISCSFAEKFSVGHFNMTRRLDFVDGITWVARVRFPSTDAATDREALSASKTMEIEIAIKTSIPVPEVHAYNLSVQNEAGAPFILMDYIHGSVASELRVQHGSARGLFGTPEQDRRFREQVARIQATVASFQFPQIGGIYYNEDANDFYIGPELQTGRGPWASSSQYYDDLAHHLLKSISKDSLRQSPSFMVPSILNFLLRLCGEQKDGPFRLANRDFGAHNILVNDDFDVVGVIDFDGVMAAPLEAVTQYPFQCFLDVEPHGVVETRPAVVERVALTLPRLQTYKDMLAKYEASAGGNFKVADRLGGIPASAYRGMTAYQSHQDFVNDRWMRSCLKMLQDLTQNPENS